MDYIVEYDYIAQNDDELTLKKGDKIKNACKKEEGWSEGELNGRKGLFPNNFVKPCGKTIITAKDDKKTEKKNGIFRLFSYKRSKFTKSKKQENNTNDENSKSSATNDMTQSSKPFEKFKAKVLYTYQPQHEDEIAIGEGQIVEVISLLEEGWYEGTCNGELGVFPANHVARLEHSTSKARVLFNYVSKKSDELTLKIGDIISILDKNSNDEGWWKGELNGRIGVFPSNFVEEIQNYQHTRQQIHQDNESSQKALLNNHVTNNYSSPTTSITASNPSSYDSMQPSQLCQICMLKNVEVSLIHLSNNTGHQVCCLSCAEDLKSKNMKCPICRGEIDAIIKNYIS